MTFPVSIILLSSTFLCGLNSAAQALPRDTVTVKKNISAVHLNYLGASIQQEKRVFQRAVFIYGAGVHRSFYNQGFPSGTRFIVVRDKFFGREYQVSAFTPYAFLEVRKYFNLLKRSNSGKSTLHNGASYFSFFAEIPLFPGKLTETPNLVLASPVGVKLGGRRNLGRRLYADASAALTGKLYAGNTVFVPRLDAAIGLVLN